MLETFQGVDFEDILKAADEDFNVFEVGELWLICVLLEDGFDSIPLGLELIEDIAHLVRCEVLIHLSIIITII